MVPDLGGIVVNAAGRRLLDDGFEIKVFVLGALDQVVQVGDSTFVKVIDIDLERRRISLSLRQANEDVDSSAPASSIWFNSKSDFVFTGSKIITVSDTEFQFDKS